LSALASSLVIIARRARGVAHPQGPHVVVAGDSGPRSGEELPAAGVDLAELDSPNSICSGGKGEASEPGEQVKVRSAIHAPAASLVVGPASIHAMSASTHGWHRSSRRTTLSASLATVTT
jgi:hypothetical protein